MMSTIARQISMKSELVFGVKAYKMTLVNSESRGGLVG